MIESCRLDNASMAVGAACQFLAGQEPFAGLAFGELVKTVAAQIQRGHYLFARRDLELLAYVGWALCEEPVATEWVSGRGAPHSDLCLNGPVFVAVTFASKETAATRCLIRDCRRLYPGRQAMFHRYYADGRPSRAGRVINRRS